jgi:hypothetical protein
MRRHTPSAIILSVLLAGCAGLPGVQSRMAVPASVGGVAEESFGKPGWGRSGEFTLRGQRVRYERGAERLSLFEPLGATRTPVLRFTLSTPSGDSVAACAGLPSEPTANSKLVAARPWGLSCRWSGASDATLQIGEGQMRRGKLSREGAYQRGELTLGLRSVHLLEGIPQPQTAAVGYEMLREGQVVGTLDLSRGQPLLRRPDPATPLGRAVTEAALALALASEPN